MRDTRQNAESSRSHQIVRIFVESRPSLPAMPEGNPLRSSLMKPISNMAWLVMHCSAVSVSVKLLCLKVICFIGSDETDFQRDLAGHALQCCES